MDLNHPGVAAGLSTFAHLLGIPEAAAPETKPEEATAPPPAVAETAQNPVSDERARCSAIFKAPGAAARPDMAAYLAFETSLAAKDAIAMLDLAAKSAPMRAASLSERMGTISNPTVGVSGGEATLSPAQQILRAHAKATGKTV